MHTIIRDDYTPQLNEYHEIILVDPTRRKTWLFDCDGVFTDITKINVVSERGDSEEYAASQKWLTEELEALEAADVALQDNIDAEETARIAADETLQDNIDAEEADRIAADTEIWDEIETLEAASDVVDIVGTKAELDNYDTSKLTDEDIIKVLQDETKEDATTYYRWDKANSTFTYVGEEGPYYTQTQVDTLLGDKVDKTSVTSTPSFNPPAASETLVMSQKGVAKQVLNENNGGIQISSAAGNASAGAPVAVAIGPDATAGASPSVAIGYQSKAGSVSTALGYGAKAESGSALAIGNSAEAAGAQDISIGSYASTKVSSGSQTSNNVAIGTSGITANGGVSFAAGAQSVKATGYLSFAAGSRYVEATGPGSVAIGCGDSSSAGKTLASGSGSLAVGQSSSAAGSVGIAVGSRALANGTYDIAIGNNCTASSAASPATAVQNIAVGFKAEATGGYSTAFGNIAVASGSTSFAAGTLAKATATQSMAIGVGNPNHEVEASGIYSLAIGTRGANASGSNSIAVGGLASASGTNSVAVGPQNCTASHTNAVALGAFSQTGRSDEISIGAPISGSTPEVTKYIAHVTAGVNDTDAVNVAQLNAAIPGVMTGATSSAAGASGLVPAPTAGDENKYLKGDGTWGIVSSGPAVVQNTGQSTTDVMSQKAVTDIIGDIETILQTLNSGTGAQ